MIWSDLSVSEGSRNLYPRWFWHLEPWCWSVVQGQPWLGAFKKYRLSGSTPHLLNQSHILRRSPKCLLIYIIFKKQWPNGLRTFEPKKALSLTVSGRCRWGDKAQIVLFWCPGGRAWHTEFLLQGNQNGSGEVGTPGEVVSVCHLQGWCCWVLLKAAQSWKSVLKGLTRLQAPRGGRVWLRAWGSWGKKHKRCELIVAEDF